MKHINNALITLVLLIGYIPFLALDMLTAYRKYRHMRSLYKDIDIILSKKESKA